MHHLLSLSPDLPCPSVIPSVVQECHHTSACRVCSLPNSPADLHPFIPPFHLPGSTILRIRTANLLPLLGHLLRAAEDILAQRISLAFGLEAVI